MLRYEREIEELLAELEVREGGDWWALPPAPLEPYGCPTELRRPSPPAREMRTAVPLVGVLLLLAGILLGGAFGQWALLIGAVLLIIAAARIQLAVRPIGLPMDNHLYHVPPRQY